MTMEPGAFRFSALLGSCLLLSGCATAPATGSGAERPVLFHDTLLQYALLTDDRETLNKDFQMAAEPSPIERVVAGAVLPFTVTIETLYWPVSAAITSDLAKGASGARGTTR
jgi:hypothetical protein